MSSTESSARKVMRTRWIEARFALIKDKQPYSYSRDHGNTKKSFSRLHVSFFFFLEINVRQSQQKGATNRDPFRQGTLKLSNKI